MHPTPSIDKAVRYIENLLDRGTLERGQRLPAIEELARGAEVSLVTMWKASRRLADKGVLCARRGVGIYVAPAGPATEAPDRLVAAISQHLLRDVLEGRFHAGESLPSIKRLRSIYDAGYRTMRSAVALLAHDGHIAKRGRDFHIRRAHVPALAQTSVLFICGADLVEQDDVGYFRTAIERFLHYFEQQCSLRNVQTRQVVISGANDTAFQSSPTTFGHIIWYTWWLEPFLQPLLERCRRLGKPTLVYDITDVSLPALNPFSSAAIRILYNDNAAAGRTVGNALLHRGHRTVCYFAERLWPWAQDRYDGLVSAFDKAGYPGAVRLCLGDPQPRAPHDQPEAWARADKAKWFIESLLKQVRDADLDKSNLGRLVNRLADAASCNSTYCTLESAMRNALRDKDATAWVTADDYIALHAVLPFLQSHRVQVPRDLSLVGFNNQFEAPYAGLSSYHFDMTGMAMRMLTFLLYPRQEQRLRPSAQAGAPEGIGGFIVERGSVGKPGA